MYGKVSIASCLCTVRGGGERGGGALGVLGVGYDCHSPQLSFMNNSSRTLLLDLEYKASGT
jgi:hypothetical protein